jgi:hypothetical protein
VSAAAVVAAGRWVFACAALAPTMTAAVAMARVSAAARRPTLARGRPRHPSGEGVPALVRRLRAQHDWLPLFRLGRPDAAAERASPDTTRSALVRLGDSADDADVL